MNTQTDFCRIENKYFISVEDVPAFLAKLQGHLDLDPYAKATGSYQVNTIYFDNMNDDVVFRSLSSPTYKCKLRLRSYGGDNPIFFLEFKKKFGSDVYKNRIFLSEEEYLAFVKKGRIPSKNGEYKHDNFVSELTDMVRRYGTLVPREVIQYDRQAFMNKPGEEYLRLTIDSHVMVRRENFALNKLAGNPLLPEDKMLIEVKLPRSLPFWLAKALCEAKAYRGPFSKYGASYNEHLATSEKAFLPPYASSPRVVTSPSDLVATFRP